MIKLSLVLKLFLFFQVYYRVYLNAKRHTLMERQNMLNLGSRLNHKYIHMFV